jgi:hypothetical protein
MRSAIVMAACLFTCACGPEATPAAPAPAPATPPPAVPAPPAQAAPMPPAVPAVTPPAPAAAAEPEDADPRINAARARYRAIEAAFASESPPKLESECNGETGLSAQLYDRDGLQKAVVRFHPPGDVSDIYDFYFEQDKPVFVLYSELGFAGGTTTLTERRYYIAEGKPFRCLSKTAKNAAGEDLSEQQIRERLQQVENKDGDCKHAKRVLALARALTAQRDPQALLTKLCTL